MNSGKVFFFLLIIFLISCSKVKEVADSLAGLSAKELYKKEENISDELFELSESRIQQGLKDSLEVELPYFENGRLRPRNFAVYSYNIYLMPGELLEAKMNTDSTVKVFSELYKFDKTNQEFQKLMAGDPGQNSLNFEIKESGLYKLLLQPEIEANSKFEFQIEKSPSYLFPVVKGRNADIGSYYGDMRDGGQRYHKGIDIFAKKGTPVLAATSGRIGFTGEKGLGGKQVWLRDRERKQSLYYAHLDSIVPNLKNVKPGDTLGFVGNTGNARTTPSHLHFGIYKRSQGAIDPLGYVYLIEEEKDNTEQPEEIPSRLMIESGRANFRNKPASSNSKIIRNGNASERLYVQGKANDWFHVRDTLDKSLFIHESLVRSAN